MIGGLDHDAAAGRWPALPEAKVPQDLLDDRRVLDHGDQPQLAAAPSAAQHVLPPHPPEKRSPGETTSAPRVVGAAEVVVGRGGGVVLLRIDSCLAAIREEVTSGRWAGVMVVEIGVKLGTYDFARGVFPLALEGTTGLSSFGKTHCAQFVSKDVAVPAVVVGNATSRLGEAWNCTHDLVLTDVSHSAFDPQPRAATLLHKLPEAEAQRLRAEEAAGQVLVQIAFELGSFSQTHLSVGKGPLGMMGMDLKPLVAFKGRAVGYRIISRSGGKAPKTRVVSPWKPLFQES